MSKYSGGNSNGNGALGCLFVTGLVLLGIVSGNMGDNEPTPSATYESEVVEESTVDEVSESEESVVESEVAESEESLPNVVESESEMETGLDSAVLTAEDIPEFDGNTYMFEVNNNQSGFPEGELAYQVGWAEFSDLDNLNRVGTANAVLSADQMPPEDFERGSISNIEPTGWKNKKIENGGYLYNRSHLIANRFLGDESDGITNLMTGTRDMNSDNDWSMTVYENMLAKELANNPDSLIRYQVTPIFKGDELLARGVQLRAKTINNDNIDFNVFIYNEYYDEDATVQLNFDDGSSVVSYN